MTWPKLEIIFMKHSENTTTVDKLELFWIIPSVHEQKHHYDPCFLRKTKYYSIKNVHISFFKCFNYWMYTQELAMLSQHLQKKIDQIFNNFGRFKTNLISCFHIFHDWDACKAKYVCLTAFILAYSKATFKCPVYF